MRIIKEFASFKPTWTTTTSGNSVSFRFTSTADALTRYATSMTRMPKWARHQTLTAKAQELHKKTAPKKERASINLGAIMLFRDILDLAEEMGFYVTPNDKRMFDEVTDHFGGGSRNDQLMGYLLGGGVITIECEDEDGETVMSELNIEDVSQGMEHAPMECISRLVSGENDEMDVYNVMNSVVDAGKKI